MSRLYTVTFNAVNLPATNAMDLFEIQPADDKICRIIGVKLGQTGIADFGDSQEEGIPIGIYRVPTSTSGSGGTTPTPRLVTPSGFAAGFVSEVNNTTVATTAGTLELLDVFTWNVRIPETQIFIPEFWYEFVQGSFGVVRVITGPSDAIATCNGTLYVEELG